MKLEYKTMFQFSSYKKLKWVAVLVITYKAQELMKLFYGLTFDNIKLEGQPHFTILLDVATLFFFTLWGYSMSRKQRLSVILTNLVILCPLVLMAYIGMMGTLWYFEDIWNGLETNLSSLGSAIASPFFFWIYYRSVWSWWIKEKENIEAALFISQAS